MTLFLTTHKILHSSKTHVVKHKPINIITTTSEPNSPTSTISEHTKTPEDLSTVHTPRTPITNNILQYIDDINSKTDTSNQDKWDNDDNKFEYVDLPGTLSIEQRQKEADILLKELEKKRKKRAVRAGIFTANP